MYVTSLMGQLYCCSNVHYPSGQSSTRTSSMVLSSSNLTLPVLIVPQQSFPIIAKPDLVFFLPWIRQNQSPNGSWKVLSNKVQAPLKFFSITVCPLIPSQLQLLRPLRNGLLHSSFASSHFVFSAPSSLSDFFTPLKSKLLRRALCWQTPPIFLFL